MLRLIRELVRPYRGTLLIILLAMLVETAMSLATPWPLKIILDNVVGHHKMSPWLADLLPSLDGRQAPDAHRRDRRPRLCSDRGAGAIATYIDNYYTESVGQWVANDLRLRTFHHLQRLSLGYYNTHQTGTMLSTITTDIQTIQGFASSSTLNILVDLLTIVCMLALMFWLNWDFTLIAVGVTPFLLLFVSRFKKAVKKATHEVRKEQSEIVAVVQQDLESIQSVKAFGRQDMEQKELAECQQGHRRCGPEGPQHQVAAIAGSHGDGGGLHRCRAVARRIPDSGRGDDGWRADCLPFVPQQVLQAGQRPRDHHQRDCPGRRWSRSGSRHPGYRHGHS